MEREEKSTIELRILCALCREAGTREQRLEILRSLEHHVFVEPEHLVVFESLRTLFVRGPITSAALCVHLNNRGFPDIDMENYFQTGSDDMKKPLEQARRLHELDTKNQASERGFSKTGAALLSALVVLAVIIAVFARPLRRAVRESLMQSVTSSHYQILCPPGAMSQAAMMQFATQREPLFTSLDQKLNDAASNTEIKVIFDREFAAARASASVAQDYTVTGTTIRTRLSGNNPKLDPAADAEALLHAAWGKPGNPIIGYWTSIWLVGERNGRELGMTAAEVDRNGGHKKVADLLDQPPDKLLSAQDRAVLGAAWLNEIAELTGPTQIEKLYNAKMAKLNLAEVTSALGTSPIELERKWQMWIYAYIAGMPMANHSMSMPMSMPMRQ